MRKIVGWLIGVALAAAIMVGPSLGQDASGLMITEAGLIDVTTNTIVLDINNLKNSLEGPAAKYFKIKYFKDDEQYTLCGKIGAGLKEFELWRNGKLEACGGGSESGSTAQLVFVGSLADRQGAKTGVLLSEIRDYKPFRDCVENEEGGVNCTSTATHLLWYDIENCNTSQQITSAIFKKRKGQFRICAIHLMQPLRSREQ